MQHLRESTYGRVDVKTASFHYKVGADQKIWLVFISGFHTKEEKDLDSEKQDSSSGIRGASKKTSEQTPLLKIDFFDQEGNQQGLSHGIRDHFCFNCFGHVTRSQIVRLTLAKFLEYFEAKKKFALTAQGIKGQGGRGSVFSQPDSM